MRSNHALVVALLFGYSAAAFAESGDDAAAVEVSFEKQVRPILKAHCLECHGEGEEIEGGIDLRLRKFILKGGDSGPAFVEGKPDESPLFELTSTEEMPPGDTKLTPDEIATIRNWIESGAKTLRPEPESIRDGVYVPEEDQIGRAHV